MKLIIFTTLALSLAAVGSYADSEVSPGPKAVALIPDEGQIAGTKEKT